MKGDEQTRLLEEALQWALVTLHSAEAQQAKLSQAGTDGLAADEEALEEARRRVTLAQETVDEIKTKLAARQESLRR